MSPKAQFIAAGMLLACILLAAAVYWAGLNGPFVLDDAQNILRAYVADFTWDDVVYAITHNTSGILGRPVSVMSLVFSGVVHGPGSWGYKYHNLAIHLINGLLIFWFLLKILPRLAVRTGKVLSEARVTLVAGLTAAFWLFHPLMVSTVLYAVQRMEQLSTLFTLAALLFYVFARITPEGEKTRFYLLAYLGFPLAAVLSFLSKETGALIPLYVLAIEMCVFGFAGFGWRATPRIQPGFQRLAVFLGIFVVLPLVIAPFYVLTHFDSLADYEGRTFTMGERVMTELHVLFFYLKLILLPRLADMSLYHDDFPVVHQMDALTLVCALVLAGALALAVYLRNKAPVAAFAILWFLISHLLESTFISLELVFEHRNYLAALGPLLAVMYYVSTIKSYPKLVYVAPVVMVLVLFLTIMRVQEWRSPGMFFEVAIQEHPDSYRANTEYATLNFNNGKRDVALDYLGRAQQLNTRDYGAFLHEIVYRCGLGRDFDTLFEQAGRRAARYPVTPYALNGMDNLLKVYQSDGCPELDLDDVLALIALAKAQDGNKVNTEYYGYLEREEGQVYLLQGKYMEAVQQLTAAYNHSGQVMILHQLADIQIRLGRLQDAGHLLEYLQTLNNEKMGIESAKLDPLLAKFEKREEELEESEAETDQ